VLVIHENIGADGLGSLGSPNQLAEAGYIAARRILLSGYGPNGGKSRDFAAARRRDHADREAHGPMELPLT